MRLLLDSHVALWALMDSERLGPVARDTILSAEAAIVSVVTPWELGIKRSIGKLDFPDGMIESLAACGYAMLPIAVMHSVEAPRLPLHHRDPFDRMLIAQARLEGLTIMTVDDQFGAYDVDVMDASS